MSPLFRRAPLVRAEIALYGPRRAAALLTPAEGRWPEHARADRVGIALATVALAARHCAPSRWGPLQAELVAAAQGIAATSEGPLPGGLVDLDRLGPGGWLEVVPWEGEGRLRVVTELARSSVGPVPKLVQRPGESGPALEIAALALLIAVAVDLEQDRLALALGVEGLMAWHRDSDRQASPRDAFAFALVHAADRLAASGGSLPPGL